jgi:hypothetical protein
MGTPPNPVDPKVPPPPAAFALGATKLRRLTRDEYSNTIRDLLGDASRPGAAFAPDALGEGGFLTGGIVSQVEADQYLETGERLATAASKNTKALAGCDAASGEDACAQRVIELVGKRAYRRPLMAEEVADLTDLYKIAKAGQFDFATRIQFVLTAILQSPNFLYRWEFGKPVAGKPGLNALTAWELASRLSYFVWASMPDEELFARAESGALLDPAELAKQAQRLLASPKSRDSLRAFRNGWLHFIDGGDVAKDTKKWKTWNAATLAALDGETEESIVRAMGAGKDGFAALFTSQQTYGNSVVAKFYGLPEPTVPGMQPLTFAPGNDRAGLLTQGALLARNSGPSATSPVRRGHIVREQLLCSPPPPPPANLNPLPPGENTMASIRQQVIDHQKDPSCSSCHRLIDGFGLALEGFDAVGLVRTMDAGKPIDASGEVAWPNVDAPVKFNGARELGAKLAADATAQRCYTQQMFRFALGRMDGGDVYTIDQLSAAFKASGLDLREVMVALAKSDAFRMRKPQPGEPEAK